jgi:hypothetical protein
MIPRDGFKCPQRSERPVPPPGPYPLLFMPLLGLAWTLPQAALLWREPDVPEEAKV